MTSAHTAPPALGASPRTIARLVGVLSLLTILGGVYAQGYVSRSLVVWRDPAVTAANILAHRNLYLSGLAVYLVEMACSIATVALMYVLLRPAGRTLALVAASMGLVACIIKTIARVFFAAPLYLLGATRFHSTSPGALNDVSLMLLLVNDHAAGIAMAFFGFKGVLSGILIARSTFLPRFLGVLSFIGGLGWLMHLWPPLGYADDDYVLIFALLSALAEIFWLLVFGVNEPRWYERSRSTQGG